MPANVDRAKQCNFYDWDVDDNNDINLERDEAGYHPNHFSFEVASPEGMLTRITRVPLTNGQTQLSVFINTIEMTVDHNGEDPDAPEIQVLLNDATLYDCEPGSKPSDVDRDDKYREVHVINVLGRDDGLYVFSDLEDAQAFEALCQSQGTDVVRTAEPLNGTEGLKVLLEAERDDDEDDDDSPAHKRLREALRGEVPDEKLEDAVVLAYDMGCRDESELSDDDMDEIHEQCGEA